MAAGKTVTFRYYSIGRDEELERTVDPYGLLLVGDEWYLIAFCHLRQAIRTFRLSRLRSRVVFATRAPHDFAPPARFSIDDYLDRPPWQLGEPVGSAAVRVTADMAWWVEAHFSRCGTITPAPADEASDDGIASDRTPRRVAADAADICIRRPTTRPQQLVAWVLSMGEAAELLEPRELRAELRAQLLRLAARLAEPPLGASKAAACSAARTPRTVRSSRRRPGAPAPCEQPPQAPARATPRTARRRATPTGRSRSTASRGLPPS